MSAMTIHCPWEGRAARERTSHLISMGYLGGFWVQTPKMNPFDVKIAYK